MTLEQLVPTLDLCQQLRDKGFPQDTALVWCQPSWGVIEKGLPYVDTQGNIYRPKDDDRLCAAPTAGELIQWIESRFPKANLVGMPGVYGWHWRIWREGDLDENEPLDAYSKNSDVEQLAALVLEVAG